MPKSLEAGFTPKTWTSIVCRTNGGLTRGAKMCKNDPDQR